MNTLSKPRLSLLFKHPVQNLLLGFILFSQLFYSYRYILQYSSSGTSPSYDDTPLEIQAVKYLIALLFLGLMVIAGLLQLRTGRLRRNRLFLIFIACVIFCIPCIKALMVGDLFSEESSVFYLIRGCFILPLIAWALLFYHQDSFIKKLLTWGIFYPFLFHVAYSIVQYVLFFSTGRLPALAYKGGVVRFGGGWDDPNGFGIFLLLPILLLLTNIKLDTLVPYDRISKSLYTAVALILLVMTISYSALIGFIAGVACFMAMTFKKIWVIPVLGLVGISSLLYSPFRIWLLSNIEGKMGSMEAHLYELHALESFLSNDLTTLIIGELNYTHFSENFYQFLLFNFGLVGLFAMAFFLVITFLRGWWLFFHPQNAGHPDFRSFIAVATSFFTGFSVASLGIPFFLNYPVNIYFWLFAGFIWVAHPPETSEQTQGD